MMVLIGLPLGIVSARYRDSWIDNLIRLVTLLGVSAPAFVWAVILMLVFAFYLPLFPIAGRISDTITIAPVTGFLLVDTLVAGNVRAFGNAAWHIVLPAFALALSGIGQAARLTRSNMVETYDKPYIEMAQSYGFPEKRIANRYAFRPSLIPSLTIIGLDFAAMLGNAFLVEAVFAWPGLSRYGVAVILRKDLNAIIGTVLIISAMFLIVNVIVDLLDRLHQSAHPLLAEARHEQDPLHPAAQPAVAARTGADRASCVFVRRLRRFHHAVPEPCRRGRRLRQFQQAARVALHLRHRSGRPRPVHPRRLCLPHLADHWAWWCWRSPCRSASSSGSSPAISAAGPNMC